MSLFTDINKILIDGHSKPFEYSFTNSYELFNNLTIEDEKIAVQEILKGIKPTNKKSWDNICSISKKWKEKTGVLFIQILLIQLKSVIKLWKNIK